MGEKIKALALTSTGLDSLLSAKIVKNLGIDVHGICFIFRFDNLAREHKQGQIESLFSPHDIPVSVIDITDEYIPMWKNPAQGWGSGVNPCIDCHLFMFRKAGAMMEKFGAEFLITGEVVGQRPMSQNRPAIFHIDKASGLRGSILRPLSAKLMPETLPEERGWVDREKLYDFSGRSRTPQMNLAKELGVTVYNNPAGGCILTEPNFSRRVKAFIEHRGKDAVTEQTLHLCRYGRHIWPLENLLVMVGRHEEDNNALEEHASGLWFFEPAEITGPVVVADGISGEDDIKLTARITARYCGKKAGNQIKIAFKSPEREGEIVVSPEDPEVINPWII